MVEHDLLVITGATARILDKPGRPDLFTDAEKDRMSRLRRPQDRDDFLAAHLLVRTCAARLIGLATEEISIVQRCRTCGGPHGRPEIVGHPGVRASLAHSRGVVAAAAGRMPVGVDVEAVPAAGGPTADELSVALTPGEIAAIETAADSGRSLLLAWTRKEACLKAGLVDLEGLHRFDLSNLGSDVPGEHLTPRSTSLGSGRLGRWTVHDWWDAATGAVGTVVAPAGAALTLAGP